MDNFERISEESIATGRNEVLASVEIGKKRRMLIVRADNSGAALVTAFVDDGERVEKLLSVNRLQPRQLQNLAAAVTKALAVLKP
jgi:hypothetical protein